MKKLSRVLVLLLVLCTLISCAPQEKTMKDFFVDADYVVKNLDKIVLIDARDPEVKKEGLVKGSVPVAWQDLAKVDVAPGEDGWGHILEADKLATVLAEKGIDKDKEVVIFSNMDQGWGEDGRIFWVLEAAGYKNLKLLSGGFEKIKDKLEIVEEIDKVEPVEVKIEKLDTSNSIKTEELSTKLKDYTIIDCRETNEFEGEANFGEARGGRIPGAKNLPFSTLFKDGDLKSEEELKKLCEEAGLSKDKEAVVYCTGGIRAAYVQVITKMLGYKTVNYEGGYYRWCTEHDVE